MPRMRGLVPEWNRRTAPLLLLLSGALWSGCANQLSGPTPTITGVSPEVVCPGGAGATLTIKGAGLSPVPIDVLSGAPQLALPRVTLRLVESLAGVAMSGTPMVIADDPAHPAASQLKSLSDNALEVTVTTSLAAGIYSIDLLSPSAPDTKQATIEKALVVLPGISVNSITPSSACSASINQSVELLGDGLVMNNAGAAPVGPTATLVPAAGGANKSYALMLNQCTDLPKDVVPALSLSLCKEAHFEIMKGDLPVGDYTVQLTNPSPADCAGAITDAKYTVLAPPTVTAVMPNTVCANGGKIVVTGQNFSTLMGTNVQLGGENVKGGTLVSSSEIDCDFTGDTYVVGMSYDIAVINPDGCTGTLPNAVMAVAGPDIAFIDTPFVGSGISTPIAIQARGISTPLGSVGLVPTGMMAAPTPITAAIDPKHPDRILAVVQTGLAAGVYDLVVSDGSGCATTVTGAITVSATLGPKVTAIDHPVGAAAGTQPETITGSGFTPGPRLYLSSGATAIAVGAVTFVSATSLSAVFPAVATGSYDLVVVNQDGTVGVLAKAYTSSPNGQPRIDSLSPAVVPMNMVGNVDINGANLRAKATVALACSGNVAIAPNVVRQVVDTQITFDGSGLNGLAAGVTCTVQVTNSDDQGSVTYATLAIGNGSGATAADQVGPPLMVARRAPAVGVLSVIGVPDQLVAAGGDSGSSIMPLGSVESLVVDGAGPKTSALWIAQPGKLTTPITLAGAAAIGRYLYLVGGNDGSAPTNKVQRAMLLDPAQAPVISDVYLEPAGGAGLMAGFYSFRVAAIADPADPDNPGGVSIASDPVLVYVPKINGGIKVTLSWGAVTGAVGYYVYRSPMGDGGAELLTSTMPPMTTSYTDMGGAAMAPAPLLAGALGNWQVLPSLLGTPRESPAVTFAADPALAGTLYLYALGGKDGMGNILSSYELLPITVDPGGGHTVGAFVAGASALATARSQAGAWTVATQNGAFVFVGGGTDGIGVKQTVEAGTVGKGGDLGAFVSAGATLAAFGFGAVVAGGSLYALGDNVPDTLIQASTPMVLPMLGPFTPSGMLAAARYLPGAALDGPMLFAVGGASGFNGPAQSATEWMVY